MHAHAGIARAPGHKSYKKVGLNRPALLGSPALCMDRGVYRSLAPLSLPEVRTISSKSDYRLPHKVQESQQSRGDSDRLTPLGLWEIELHDLTEYEATDD